MIADYRKRGLIIPIGFAMAGGGISAFYHPRQITEVKNALGITLENTEGLLSEREFIRTSKLFRIAAYRKEGLIKPVGHGLTHSGLCRYYHPKQIAELKKALGITLESTEG